MTAGSTPTSDPGSVALSEVLDTYELVEVGGYPLNPYLIVTERGHDGVYHSVTDADGNVQLADVDLRELGTSSPSPWTNWLRDDHVTALRGERGLAKYMEMKRSSGTVRGSLRLFKTPILGARWYVEPQKDNTREVNIAKRFQQMLFEDMSRPFSELINEILLMVDYGHMVFEKVYFEYPDGFLGWSKLAPRHPMDIQEWVWDKNGGPVGVRMKSTYEPLGTFIPISKLIVFTMDIEAGDLRGTSILRSAYQHWYYTQALYKIDAIQKERHGIGVPVIKLPPGFSEEDKKLAEDLGRNLRTNERAHIVLPSNWDVLFAKLEGQPVDVMKSIDHHNQQISMNVLAPFMQSSSTSTQDMDDKKQSLFMKSTKYVATTIADSINMHGFRDLVARNYVRPPGAPMLRARRIGEWDDLRTLSFALRNLIGADIIRPDDPLEAAMRQEFDLPIADADTMRLPPAPQSPFGGDGSGGPTPPGTPDVGPPRQAQAGNQKTGPQSSAAGRDTSGGN
jgi:hypothetical protein